jgi:hypothetical protein
LARVNDRQGQDEEAPGDGIVESSGAHGHHT